MLLFGLFFQLERDVCIGRVHGARVGDARKSGLREEKRLSEEEVQRFVDRKFIDD